MTTRLVRDAHIKITLIIKSDMITTLTGVHKGSRITSMNYDCETFREKRTEPSYCNSRSTSSSFAV
jgi:hypothetical protein